MYDDYDDGEGGGTSIARKVALGIGVIAVAAAGFFAFQGLTGDDGGGETVTPATASSSVDGTEVASTDDPSVTAQGDDPVTASTDEADDATAASDPETSTAQSPTRASTTTEAVGAPTTEAASPPTTASTTYPTRDDGTPEWITVIYDVDSITLKGVAPDEAAKAQLEALATQYGKPEQQATVNNLVTLNPAMPRDVGVRVVELTSTRFPPGSDEIVLEQAAEINRVVAAMQALPQTSALIIGHADQNGDEVVNYVLSRDRADAVLAYLISQGIAPERLTATAVGEEELLSLDDDEAALALNRRTEFVLFNLLTP